MLAPFLLLCFSLAGIAASLLTPELSDLLLLAGPLALASLILLVKAWLGGTSLRRSGKEKLIVLDGSNVMHWRDGVPDISTVREVTNRLSALGFTPGVIFDANVGYKLEGRYRGEKALARHLGLPNDRVLVVSKGSPADPTILAAARELEAPIVSNDRFRDWVDDHPELREPGHLIRGGYRNEELWLDVSVD